MRKTLLLCLLMCLPFLLERPGVAEEFTSSDNGDGTFSNLLLWADVPDPCVIRVEDAYYMVSTTMHMSPGIPVMRSYDLVNWEIVSYCYSQLDTGDAFSLKNGKNDYANGSWASNIRYDKILNRFFVINACNTTGKSTIYSTDDIEKGRWRCDVVEKCYDPGLLFDGDNRYVIYGQQGHHYRQVFVNPKTYEVTLGAERLWKHPMSHDGNDNWVEGAHSVRRGEYLYIPVIELRERRVQSVWRGKDINDPESWEARKIFSGDIIRKDGTLVLPSSGIAQGGFVDTPDGKWYAMLFQDTGAVGRTPVLIPIEWSDDGWPILGNEGKSVDEILPMPSGKTGKTKAIVSSDEFDNEPVRHIFSSAEANSTSRAGLSVQEINQAFQATLNSKNLIENGSVAGGGVSGWTVNGGAGHLEAKKESSGNWVLKTSRRQFTISGPLQDLAGKLESGSAYNVSLRVKYNDHVDDSGRKIAVVDEREFKVTMRLSGRYDEVAISRVKKGEWATIVGSYKVPNDANVDEMQIFVETSWAPTDELSKEAKLREHTFDFYIDDMSVKKYMINELVAENEYEYNGSNLNLNWQWNHNPNNNLWSLTDRHGFLRLKSGLLSRNVRDARNTLTQRTWGPTCSANTTIDVSHMKDGDVAGLSAFQNQFGFVGVKMQGGQKSIVMQRAQKKDDAKGAVIESISLQQENVYLKVDCDFRDRTDKAYFYYSLDGKTWKPIGDVLQMHYDWPDFMGYRFGLFYYSTEQLGGYVDFDHYHIADDIDSAGKH